MFILLSLSPWVVLWVFGTENALTWSPWVALGLSIVVTGVGVGRKRPKVLDIGTLVFFASIAFASLFVSTSWLSKWGLFISKPALLAIVLVSMAIKKPFTIQYARETVPEELWDNPYFYSINMTICRVWAAAFGFMTATGVVGAIYNDNTGMRVVFNIIMPITAFVAGFVFSSWYPDWKVARIGEELGAADAGRAPEVEV